jgi:glycosyltransferase involved in cell wall biosynthesis
MKRLLLVCYYFPPLGGAGIDRPLALCRLLHRHGWEVDVLTVKDVAYRVFEPELLGQADRARIFRADSYDPQRLLRLAGIRTVKPSTSTRLSGMSQRFFPDNKAGWIKPAIRLGRTIAENRHYDAILSTAPPIATHVVAKKLAYEFQLPWIADYRDLWSALTIEQTYRRKSHVARALRLRDHVVTGAVCVTAVNDSVASYVGATEVIPNGYNEQLADLWRDDIDSKRFVIGLLGSQNELYPVEPLFKLLAKLRESDRSFKQLLQIVQVGLTDQPFFDELIAKYRLDDCINCCGVLSREETITALSSAALFYVASDLDSGSAFSTGRIYTLLASGRPIHGYCAKESELARLIELSGGSRFDEKSESDAIYRLHSLFAQWGKGEIRPKPIPESIKDLSHPAMVAKFAACLDRLCK